jgi:hypothetical protein
VPILNRNKVSVPDMTGTEMIEYVRLIKIDPDSGLFSATLPDFLHQTAALVAKEQELDSGDGDVYKWPVLDYWDQGKFEGEISAKTREKVIESWESLIYRCREFLTTQSKFKVILLNTEMNVNIYDDAGDGRLIFRRSDVSFAKTNPLVGVNYRVCFQAGKHLVDDDNKRVYGVDKGVVIPHTSEREAFLRDIVDTFERAALQLNEFVNLVKNDPLQIETVMKRGFLLAHAPDEVK